MTTIRVQPRMTRLLERLREKQKKSKLRAESLVFSSVFFFSWHSCRDLSAREFLFVIRNEKNPFVNLSCQSCRMPSTVRGRGLSPDDCPNCGGTGYVAKPV